jgi:hypothetical protein
VTTVDPATKSQPTARPLTLVLGGIAAFSAYFAMYAFRKPFAAATFSDQAGWHFVIDYKTTLLIAQVVGYALSKFIGIRVIAEFGRNGRALAILGLIAASWVALILFAIVPAPWNVPFMFLNGLPLGMIWGLVFSYVEGRRASEAMGAMLCASFILASGVVKTVATLVMRWGVSEYWMPAVTGALFIPVLLVSLWMLERLPPPDARDEAERTPRVPMLRADRAAFLARHGMAMVLLVSGYVLLTAIRDFRDNFAAELWRAMGYGGVAAVFTESEIPVAVLVLVALGVLMLVKDNLRALLAMHGIVFIGAVLLGVATLAYQAGLLAPLPYMVLTGAGLYLAYTPFNAMLFDRMIAAIGHAGNAGFLIYIADASGYAGSVALLLYRSLTQGGGHWLSFYIDIAYVTAIAVAVLTSLSAAYFFFRVGKHRVAVPA